MRVVGRGWRAARRTEVTATHGSHPARAAQARGSACLCPMALPGYGNMGDPFPSPTLSSPPATLGHPQTLWPRHLVAVGWLSCGSGVITRWQLRPQPCPSQGKLKQAEGDGAGGSRGAACSSTSLHTSSSGLLSGAGGGDVVPPGHSVTGTQEVSCGCADNW